MRFHIVFSVLLLLCGLAISGCGESVEESEATALAPEEDFRFQDLPLVEGGSLISPEEIPVITIEKTREDAENVWWRLKADPVPTQEDLVVGIRLRDSMFRRMIQLGYVFDNYGHSPHLLYVAILKFENSSGEIRVPKLSHTSSLQIASLWGTIRSMIDDWTEFLADTVGHRPEEENFSSVDLPPIRLSDGHIIPQGFRFSYYLLGETSELEIPAQE